jgi:hypothetical protein
MCVYLSSIGMEGRGRVEIKESGLAGGVLTWGKRREYMYASSRKDRKGQGQGRGLDNNMYGNQLRQKIKEFCMSCEQQNITAIKRRKNSSKQQQSGN